MNYILDTNICVHMLNHKSFNILKHARKSSHTSIYISSITVSELWYGVFNSSRKEENIQHLENFLEHFPKLDYDHTFARTFGELRMEQKKRGLNVGHYDLLIASQALELDAILITNNEKEFKQIKDLRIENWLRAN